MDQRLGLPKYDRYDPCVKAMIVESYADINSMIKVGQLIGDRIYSPFSLNTEREHFRISRQTVFNTLRSVGELFLSTSPVTHTPNSLIIMADEKYIPLQGTNKKKQMVKAATIYETTHTKHKRTSLLGKQVYFHTGNHFWENILDILHDKYDFDTIQKFHILGDGASWIKAGVSVLKTTKNDVSFSLDRFHYRQAINRITSHTQIKDKLIDYIQHNDKKNFKLLTRAINNDSDLKLHSTENNIQYIINQWLSIQNSLHHIRIPCSMEAAISHNIASHFTSVPKAFKKTNLQIYLNHRMLHLNHFNLRFLYLSSLQFFKTDNRRKIASSLDFSLFEPSSRYDKSSSSHWVKGFIARN